MQSRYDPPTALTFLLAGLSLGTLITLMFAPRSRAFPKVVEIFSRRRTA